MEIELVRASREGRELRWLKRLFLSAFPREERPPFFIMRWRANGNVDWWKIRADREDAGFFYVVKHGELVYVFFFAVDERLRGRRIGTEALKMLLRKYSGKVLFLAIERIEEGAPNLRERIARRDFYLRCGLTELRGKVREGSVVYDLLGTGGAVSNAGYQALMRNWAGPVLSRLVRMEVLDGDAEPDGPRAR